MQYHNVHPPLSPSLHVISSTLILETCQSTTLCIELHAFPMHLQSSSTYSDALHIGLHMLCNSALPPASMPLHMPPLLVCLFVYLCHWHTCCLFCLFVSP